MYTWRVIVVLCLLFSTITPAQSSVLMVEYNWQGEIHQLQGEKTLSGYRFNTQSNKVLNLATLDWPPYIGEELCNKGWVFQFTVALLVAKGYQVNIHFFPWARAVKQVELGQMDILFPEYFIEELAPSDNVIGTKRRQLLALSNKFPGGTIGFIKRKGEEIDFDGNLSRLVGENIGVVRGYQNTPDFDAMMDNNQFNILNAVDEVQLLRLLLAKRVNLVIGDPIVFRHSVKYFDIPDWEKEKMLAGIEDVEPSLQYNHLYYAVSVKSPQWQQIINDINDGLAEFSASGEINRIIDVGSECAGTVTQP